MVGQDAVEIVLQAAAGDMGHAVQARIGKDASQRLEVASMGFEHGFEEGLAGHVLFEQIRFLFE